MQSFSYYLTLPCVLSVLVVSIALNPPHVPNSLILGLNSSLIPTITNTSESTNAATSAALPLLGSTLTAIPLVVCDDNIFGRPPAASCREAISQIPNDPATIIRNPKLSIGPRGLGHWDVSLPKRFISCNSYCLGAEHV